MNISDELHSENKQHLLGKVKRLQLQILSSKLTTAILNQELRDALLKDYIDGRADELAESIINAYQNISSYSQEEMLKIRRKVTCLLENDNAKN